MSQNMLRRMSDLMRACQIASSGMLKRRAWPAYRAARPITAETLESRILLSGYSLSTLATYSNLEGNSTGLVADASGNLYGVLGSGGPFGAGSVFELAAGTHFLTTLAFFDGADGNTPESLLMDAKGNLFGTTLSGGTGNFGTVFEIAAGTHALSTLVNFNGTDGSEPAGNLSMDSSGNLYGMTESGGIGVSQYGIPSGYGTLFEIASGTHAFSTLFALEETNGGPTGLVVDSEGDLFWTTPDGGTVISESPIGVTVGGALLELNAATHEISTLVSFDGTDGEYPNSLMADADGNFYGTTVSGGASNDGTVFEVKAGTHAFSTLASFTGPGGEDPVGGLIVDTIGNLYGVTFSGGLNNNGTVFEVRSGTDSLVTLAFFNGSDGSAPDGGVILDANGNLYGTTTPTSADPADAGTVFELSPTNAPAAKLAIIQQPTNTFAGIEISPSITVAVEDANGDVVTSDNSTITLTVASGPQAGSGSATVVNGVATFSTIALDTVGSYTVAASDGSLTGATSASFAINPPGSIDTANMNVISGWAYDPTDPANSANVEIVITGGPTQTFSADQSRGDLQTVIGSSNHGFTYSTPVLSVGSHTVYIYVVEANSTKILLATKTLVSQNSLFDEHYYLATNPDVAAAVADGEFATGYDHYIKYGQYEGRSPSPYWDEAWYLKENPDVAAAVKAGTVSSGFMQYYLYGQYENRGGLLYFNTSYYLQNNADVAAAVQSGEFTSAFEHFVLFGQYEGRSPMKYFSSTVYDTDNGDIIPYVSGETFSSDFEQFVEYGQYEDRIASNYYNEMIYLSLNPDVAAAVMAGDYPDGFQQWLEYGQYEGRTAV